MIESNKCLLENEKKYMPGDDFGETTEKPKLLLHSCCGPCSTAVIERLVPFFDITVFYFNPNITESEEYNLRLNEQKRFIAEAYGDKIKIIEGRYKSVEFFLKAEGLQKEPEGGKRCEMCFAMRLFETAKTAKEKEFDYFCSTLSVSPHKNAEIINSIGEKLCKEFGVKYLVNDFKKENGYKRSVELSEKYELYRQRYCGCIYSKYANLPGLEETEEPQT